MFKTLQKYNFLFKLAKKKMFFSGNMIKRLASEMKQAFFVYDIFDLAYAIQLLDDREDEEG